MWGILLCSAVVVVYDDLQVAQEEGTSSLTTHAAGITARVGQLEEDAFHAEITQAFTIARSHYDREINLEVMSQGFLPGYEDSELDEIEKAVTPIAWNLANRLKDMVLPSWKYFHDDVRPLPGWGELVAVLVALHEAEHQVPDVEGSVLHPSAVVPT